MGSILGSYARLLVGATGLEPRQLSQPIAGRVYFAGEALHPTDPGTVHGAFWSG
ncbi:FAD-dependent oxidoreductase [Nostoc sp. CHAB 5824]|nr:FAD-dependent oxidoreductase [Nostoc sp. CHAB 5824]